MSEEFAQQMIDILLLSDNFQLQSFALISKVADYDETSNEDRQFLAEAFDMLCREKLIWIEDGPVYEKGVNNKVYYNDTLIGLTKTGANASIN